MAGAKGKDVSGFKYPAGAPTLVSLTQHDPAFTMSIDVHFFKGDAAGTGRSEKEWIACIGPGMIGEATTAARGFMQKMLHSNVGLASYLTPENNFFINKLNLSAAWVCPPKPGDSTKYTITLVDTSPEYDCVSKVLEYITKSHDIPSADHISSLLTTDHDTGMLVDRVMKRMMNTSTSLFSTLASLRTEMRAPTKLAKSFSAAVQKIPNVVIYGMALRASQNHTAPMYNTKNSVAGATNTRATFHLMMPPPPQASETVSGTLFEDDEAADALRTSKTTGRLTEFLILEEAKSTGDGAESTSDPGKFVFKHQSGRSCSVGKVYVPGERDPVPVPISRINSVYTQEQLKSRWLEFSHLWAKYVENDPRANKPEAEGGIPKTLDPIIEEVVPPTKGKGAAPAMASDPQTPPIPIEVAAFFLAHTIFQDDVRGLRPITPSMGLVLRSISNDTVMHPSSRPARSPDVAGAGGPGAAPASAPEPVSAEFSVGSSAFIRTPTIPTSTLGAPIGGQPSFEDSGPIARITLDVSFLIANACIPGNEGHLPAVSSIGQTILANPSISRLFGMSQ